MGLKTDWFLWWFHFSDYLHLFFKILFAFYIVSIFSKKDDFLYWEFFQFCKLMQALCQIYNSKQMKKNLHFREFMSFASILVHSQPFRSLCNYLLFRVNTLVKHRTTENLLSLDDRRKMSLNDKAYIITRQIDIFFIYRFI